MTGRTAREATKTLVRFERRMDSHSASVMSSVARIVAKPPALLTSTSTRPQRLTAASTTPCICAGAAASAPKPTASAPVSRRRLAAASAPTHLQLGGEHLRLRKPCLEARDVGRGAPCRDLGIEPPRTRLPAALAAAPSQLQRGGGAGGCAVDVVGEQTSRAEHAEDERLAVDEAERLGVAGR